MHAWGRRGPASVPAPSTKGAAREQRSAPPDGAQAHTGAGGGCLTPPGEDEGVTSECMGWEEELGTGHKPEALHSKEGKKMESKKNKRESLEIFLSDV